MNQRGVHVERKLVLLYLNQPATSGTSLAHSQQHDILIIMIAIVCLVIKFNIVHFRGCFKRIFLLPVPWPCCWLWPARRMIFLGGGFPAADAIKKYTKTNNKWHQSLSQHTRAIHVYTTLTWAPDNGLNFGRSSCSLPSSTAARRLRLFYASLFPASLSHSSTSGGRGAARLRLGMGMGLLLLADGHSGCGGG